MLANALPHCLSGLMGQSFQTPFAKPRGLGRSSSTLNVLWGFLNLVVGYVLVCRVGDFDLKSTADVLALGLGALALSVFLAQHFGRFNGGHSSGPV
ncbi:MAG: hypothetical protein ACRESL_25940 [Pseudomonas sp.]